MSTPYYNAGNGVPIVVEGQVVHSNNRNNSNDSNLNPASTDTNHMVQGQVVHSNYDHDNSNNNSSLIPASTYHNNNGDNGNSDQWTKGEKQPNQCRDGFWAVLFYVHLVAVAYASAKYAPAMAQDMADGYGGNNDDDGRRSLFSVSRWLDQEKQEADYADYANGDELPVDMGTIMFLLGVSGLAGLILSSLAMGFMMNFAQGLIKMALWFNILVTLTMCILAIVAGVVGMAILAGVGVLFSAYYAYVVWHRIPFAASNLVTAITAVRANMGLAFFAYTNLIVSFLWSVWWGIAFLATFYVLSDCDAEGNCENQVNGGLMFVFLVSYYWTTQVIKNVVHVTVAGTVGTWWFSPEEASKCCSRGVRDSYLRSITTSFGSICLGSLIVALIQAVQEVLRSVQDDGILMCCAQCLLGCIASLVEYFNQWAFVFVGLYGYSFMEAGTNVMTLFRNRGWTAIITDILVDTVLLMVSLGVGILTALVVLVVGAMVDMDGVTLGIAFVLGLMNGFVMCNTLFSLVSSAVNAVIVCYAEAPSEFQANHPRLSQDMQASWSQAYPVDFRY
jgi:hypothetical protein